MIRMTRIMRIIFLAIIMIIHTFTARGQIKIMEKPQVQGLLVQKYDSLTNFEEKYYGQNNPNYNTLSYHHLIGQTILYCGSDFKQCKYGEYYKIASIIKKNNVPYFVLINEKTKKRIEITGVMYNSQFVVQGHYEKLKQLYLGKKFLYTPNNWSNDSHFFNVKTGNYSIIDDGSIWLCTDIQVENRRVRSHSNKFSPLLMVFTSDDKIESIYCYYEAFFDMKDISSLSNKNAREQYFVSKYGEKFGSAILNGRLETGMTKQMIKSLFGSQAPSSKTSSIIVTNGKTQKEEKWIYKGLVTNQGGNPLILTLVFDENEKLSNWNLE